MPAVSIIIPCYNAESWIAQTLDSALAQTWTDSEIIVVDDGSTDGSPSILASYQDRGVRIFPGPHRNAAAARNEGLRHASGSWIQFLDADDLLDPDKISAQMETASRTGQETLLSGAWDRFVNDPAEATFTPQANWRDLDGIGFMRLLWEECLMMHPAAWLTPRILIDKAGTWDERLTLNDDGEFFTRMMLESGRIVFCPLAHSYYRSGIPGSLSRQKSRTALESLYLSTELMTAEVLAKENNTETRGLCAYAWKWLAFELYPGHPELSLDAEKKCKALGGSSKPFHAGGKFRLASKFLGWRTAKRLFLG